MSTGTESSISVVYILGAGRSGSTVLNSVLGNHPEMVGLGELRRLYDAGWTANEYCACAERVADCPFWSRVREHWADQLGRDDVAGALRAQSRFERLRTWHRLPFQARRKDGDFARFADDTRALLTAIREASGARVLIDSSKSPARALALSLIEGIDLRVIHLIRDGRGVAWSLKKSWDRDERGGIAHPLRGRPVLRTALFWSITNFYSERLCRRLGPAASIRLRYEDFVTDPVTAFAAIGGLLDLDLGPLASDAAAGKALAIGHTVAGNRLRMRGPLKLRLDEAWREAMGSREKILFQLFAGPYLRRYRYAR